MSQVLIYSIIICPRCELAKEEMMPLDSPVTIYKCTKCRLVLKLKKDDCCVFCTYGTIPCPSIQTNGGFGDSHCDC